MPLTPGLVPNIRQVPEADEQMPDGEDIIIEMAGDDADVPDIDTKGNILKIEHGDGSVTVSLDGRPIGETEDKKSGDWFDNLVDEIDGSELSRISGELLRGISDDIQSRHDWIEDRKIGLKLLGLKIEVPA